ncbi:tRNA (adenosine(37)-N6)-dimethylallyltransferase MiaA [Natronospira proteinivora]|nr:tRNA (adenosine(37)-N6)-dimethylallyltransferase MiaA [Natronospira proteinivora]
MGPTASGKTDIAVDLTARWPFEIISVDSAMVYKGMDIGTAKPDADTLTRAPHRLIDFLDPAEPYSAARFRDDAMAAIDEIHATGRIPLLVGGTMLYYRALLQGLSDLPDADPTIRARLEAEAEVEGWEALHRRLVAVDPAAARRIHPNDPQRIQRALEVHALTGRPMTELQQGRKAPNLPWPVWRIGLMPAQRTWLHARIARRFEAMMAAGLEAEVEALMVRGDLHLGLPALRAVGYRQVWEYLAGEYDRDEAQRRGIVATRQLAKRQITWMRSEPALTVIECDRPAVADRVRRTVAEHLGGL